MGFAIVGAFASFSSTFSSQVESETDEVLPVAAIRFATTAPALGQAVETTLSGAPSAADYRWISWPACGDAADGVEVGTGASYVPTEDDLEHWLQVQVWQDSTLVCSNKLYFSRLPVVYLTTDDGLAVTNKEYVAATLKIQGNSEFAQQYDGATQVKGRGNSSWSLYPQKSYKLKLDKKTDLFGFGKNKHWALVSCFHDRAFLRNKFASELGKALGVVGMDMTWVDVVYNGEYHGVYMLCEHLRVGENRVEIFDWEDEAESVAGKLYKAVKSAAALTAEDKSALETQMSEDLSWMSDGLVVFKGQTYDLSDYGLRKDYDFSGGYLFEIDSLKDGITRFETPGGLNVHVDKPEFADSNAAMYNAATSLWTRFEQACASADGRCADGARYTEIADLDSMVAFWLVNELMGQGDTINSRFSFIDQGGKLTFGPVWDYDFSSGAGPLAAMTGGAFMTFGGKVAENWFYDWVQHQDFRSRAMELYWQVARPKMMELVDSPAFDEVTALLCEAGAAEDARWGMYPNPILDENTMPSHEADVVNMRTYILKHIAWLDVQFASEKAWAQHLKSIFPGQSCVAYDMAGGTTTSELRTLVDPGVWFNISRPRWPGYVFAGWTIGGDVSAKARWSVQRNTSQPMSSATLCGTNSNYCAFRGLAEPGGVVCLRANWVPPGGGYAIEYDLAGGRAEATYPVSAAMDEDLELPAPVRNGYEFAGWSLEGSLAEDASFSVPGADASGLSGAIAYGGGFERCGFRNLTESGGFVRLKAHWTVPGGYAVEYDLNGGAAGSAYQDAIACNGWLYLKKPVKDGCEFAGWSLDGDISGAARYSTRQNVSQLLASMASVSYGGGYDYCSFYALAGERGAVLLRAYWTVPGGYAVEYDLCGGKAGSSYRDSIACNGWLYLKAPVKDGYEFAGWTLEGDISGSARYSTKSCVSHLLTSTKKTYGSGHDYCSFRGLTEELGMVRLRANWVVPGGYAIEYDLAGGAADEAYPVSIVADEWLELPAPHRNGYEFAGWSLEGEIPDGALFAIPGSDAFELNGAYTCGGGFESCRFHGLAKEGGFVRFKAHWSIPGGYAVEYDLDGGKAGSAYPDSFARTGWLYLKTPVKDGYEFAGWSIVGDISGIARYSTQSGAALLLNPAAVAYGGGHDYCSFYSLADECGTVLLRANWAVPGGYAVEYDLAGGVATGNHKSSAMTTAWMAVPAPQREGYVFAGWTVEGLDNSASARYAVEFNKSNPVVAGTPCGAGYPRCSFKALADAGATVRLVAHWLPL